MQKRYLTIASAIAVVFIIVAVILFSQKTSTPTDNNVQDYNNITSTSTDESALASTTPSAPKSQKAPSQPSPTLSYNQALNLYKNQKIQITSPCQILPPDLVFKNGTKLMIDNRTPETKNIYFNGTKYTVSGYGFKIINLYSSTLPHIIIINCGTGVNNGRIILNK